MKRQPMDVPCPRGCGRDAYEVDTLACGAQILHFAVCKYEPPKPPTRWQRALAWVGQLLYDVWH